MADDKDTKAAEDAALEEVARAEAEAAAAQAPARPTAKERAESAARSKAENEAHPLTETVPGGRYRVGDQWLDADGKVLKG